jgi:hypothetical protein
MYPEISPDLKIKSTISHPLRPEEVIGFVGRNKMLGRLAIVMKEDAIEGNQVQIPSEATASLLDEDAEMVVLDGDVVLAMEASDFATERQVRDVEGRGRTATINLVNRDSDKFLSWDESMVEVSN